MSLKSLMQCAVCFEEYDTTHFIPMINGGCGHTLCAKCISKFCECPMCRTKISSPVKNYAYCEIVEKVQERIKYLERSKTKVIKLNINARNVIIGGIIIVGVGYFAYKAKDKVMKYMKPEKSVFDFFRLGLISSCHPDDIIQDVMKCQ